MEMEEKGEELGGDIIKNIFHEKNIFLIQEKQKEK